MRMRWHNEVGKTMGITGKWEVVGQKRMRVITRGRLL